MRDRWRFGIEDMIDDLFGFIDGSRVGYIIVIISLTDVGSDYSYPEVGMRCM
jgi:hypothetical protein